MKKVQILMSTCNGELYIREQLDSLLAQSYPNIDILIRDDGSKDNTLEIIGEYMEQHKQISLIQGQNVGVIQSFFELMRNSDEHADYYSLADQDDVWHPDKIRKAVGMLDAANHEKPLLYCSDTNLVDEDLGFIKKEGKHPRHPNFGNALVQNICTGCTAVMNRQLRKRVISTRPKNIIMHDWWLYITAAIYGQVLFDEEAYIFYRQHGDNAFGMKKNKKEVWKYRFQQLFQKRGELYSQLEEVKRWYPDMSDEHRKLLEKTLKAKSGFANKIKLISDKCIYRNSFEDDLVYRAIVLLGKL